MTDLTAPRTTPPLWTRLMDYWTEDEARLWLASPHPLLGGAVPSELLAKGEGDKLHQMIDRLDSDGYV